MKILHLAAGNRWTGAAATAFAEVAALREAGVDAHYAYVGGYKLQAKLAHVDFAHPVIAKAQNPMSFARSASAIETLVGRHGFDFVHAHLTYDHWLARFAVRGRAGIARTFHSSRVIRSDPFTKALLARTRVVCVINDTFRDAAPIRARSPQFTPPALDDRQFRPDGGSVREKYALPRDLVVIAAIGKLSRGRGFELVLQTFAAIRRQVSNVRLMIIGHGEHRPALESLARELQIDRDLIWAGYHEEDLANYYRAADFLLFTAKGSDEGHRAVIEAMACATVPVTVPLPGMTALLGDLSESLIAPEPAAGALAARVIERIGSLNELRPRVAERSAAFAYAAAAERLLGVYTKFL